MAAGWQDLATEQAELLSDRLRELLSTGLGLLRSELGVDVGLKPELYPSWVILLTTFIGLLVIVVFWAVTCVGLFGGKKRSTRTTEECNESTKAAVTKAVKTEEQKKKNKKKPAEKCSIVQQKEQPNGRTVVDLQEDTKVTEENLKPFPAEVKTEKTKKSKKKPKTEVKQTKTAASADGKEPDEGTWETKISNREKRQQRKKDKHTEESGSPGGGDAPANTPVEQPRPTAAISVGQRKSKGETQRSKGRKEEAVISQVSASWSESSALNGGGWNDMAMKVPTQTLAADTESWNAVPRAAGRPSAEVPAWGQEIEGSWAGADRRMKTDRNPASFGRLGLNPTGEKQPVSDPQWDGLPQVDDGWLGLNGVPADPGSDWNAPSELWGNYEEPQPECPAPPEEPAPEAKGSEDEKEKGDGSAEGSGKPKKKKKKKKKQEDAAPQDSGEPEKEASAVGKKPSPAAKEKVRSVQAGAPVAEARPERPPGAANSVSQKPSSQVPQRLAEPESTAKQNSAPAPAQKKPEENWESPKQVKKKKARRET